MRQVSRQWRCCLRGWDDSAWFEHTFLADEMGIALVQSVRPIGAGRKAVAPLRFRRSTRSTCVYARMDEDMLLSSTGYDGAPLRPGLLEAVERRHVDDRQCTRQRNCRRQGDLRPRAGDDRVLPRREADARAGAHVDLRRTRTT